MVVSVRFHFWSRKHLRILRERAKIETKINEKKNCSGDEVGYLVKQTLYKSCQAT